MLIDTNIILRYLINDDTVQSPKSKEVINNNYVTIEVPVLFEVLHVLEKVYQIARPDIRDTLNIFLQKPTVYIEKFDSIRLALNCYVENHIDFVDALLWAYHVAEGEPVFTFDKKLNRLLQQNK